MRVDIKLPTERESEQIAAQIAACLQAPAVIAFRGEIGMGKTTLIRALLRSLGVSSAIKSPTFSLVESYEIGEMQLHHFDLYRIHDETELDYIGFRDYFGPQAVCCIEWPERGGRFVEKMDLMINLTRNGAGRDMQMQAYTATGIRLINCIKGTI